MTEMTQTTETAETTQAAAAAPSTAFADLGLAAQLVQQLTEQGISEPTPIQSEAIPVLLAGQDLMASAQTGTGKTAAFLLPALQKLSKPASLHSKGPRVLILTPTRELAEQVAKVASDFSRRIPKCKVACFVGGVPYPVQNRLLAQPIEILVATPGRLQDLMRGGRVDFRRLELFILDEADRMLDMGFIDEVKAIAAQLPKERQTALFSATLSDTVQSFAAPILRTPRLIEIAPKTMPQPQIDQAIHYADGYDHKLKLTAALLKEAGETQSIVFTATKVDADGVAEWLRLEGFRAAAMHGDLAQRDRRRTLDRLRRGEIDMLIATDVAARGIDVAGIGLVLNFDLPKFAEDYIHRIGRTGRAGRSGRAISLVGRNDFQPLTRIRRIYKLDFETLAVAGLEANFRPERNGARTGGKPQGGRGKRPGGQGSNRGQQTSWGQQRHQEARPQAQGNVAKPSFPGDTYGDARPFNNDHTDRSSRRPRSNGGQQQARSGSGNFGNSNGSRSRGHGGNGNSSGNNGQRRSSNARYN